MSLASLRLATADDLPAINAIYNHYVDTSTTTYDLEPMPPSKREAWLADRSTAHPVTVVERGGQVVAWGALSTFRAQPGYHHTVENSVYVHPDHQRQGLGTLVVADQIERAPRLGLRAIVALIDSEQTASLAMHGKLGFREVGRLVQVGHKFDRWLDVVVLEIYFPQ